MKITITKAENGFIIESNFKRDGKEIVFCQKLIHIELDLNKALKYIKYQFELKTEYENKMTTLNHIADIAQGSMFLEEKKR